MEECELIAIYMSNILALCCGANGRREEMERQRKEEERQLRENDAKQEEEREKCLKME